MTEVATPGAAARPGASPGDAPGASPDGATPLRALFADRRLVAMVGLGFGSGIPLSLVFATQSAWLSEAGVPISTIGFLSEMTFAYKLKFLWAPLLDRYEPPLLGRRLGRRRGWIVLAQAGVALTLVGIASGDPAHRLAWTVALSMALGFAGATQDAVIDGWRITAAPVERQALMSSWAETGWRVGGFVSGAGALYLAAGFGWRASYLCMALAMAPALAAALLAPEPERDKGRGEGRDGSPAPLDLRRAVVEPFRELFGRLGPLALPTLLLVAGFRAPGYISNAMAFPLFKALHYGDADIATATKLFGFPVGLAGTFTASAIVKRFGLMETLLFGTVFASASHLSLAYLAAHGDHGGGEFWLFAGAVALDEFAYAFAAIVLITFMSSLSAPAFAASQFALLSSLCALPGSLVAGTSGLVIERLGFTWFFVGTSLIGLPVALLCWHVWRLQGRDGVRAA